MKNKIVARPYFVCMQLGRHSLNTNQNSFHNLKKARRINLPVGRWDPLRHGAPGLLWDPWLLRRLVVLPDAQHVLKGIQSLLQYDAQALKIVLGRNFKLT